MKIMKWINEKLFPEDNSEKLMFSYTQEISKEEIKDFLINAVKGHNGNVSAWNANDKWRKMKYLKNVILQRLDQLDVGNE